MDQPVPERHDPAEAGPRRRTDRRLAMIQAARTLFLDRGYSGVTLQDVVRVSGGSLATLYAQFGNKAGLLRAVMGETVVDAMGDLDRLVQQGHAPSEILRRLAAIIYQRMSSPERLGINRIVVGEALHDPDFARAFHQQVRLPAIRQLAALFEAWTAAGHATIDRPLDAAEQFIAMVMLGEMGALCCADALCLETGAPPIDWRIAPFLSHYRVG